jgi:hypothetical protein
MALKNLIKNGTYSVVQRIEYYKDSTINFITSVFSDNSKKKRILDIPFSIDLYKITPLVKDKTKIEDINEMEIIKDENDGKLYQKISDKVEEFKEWKEHFSSEEISKENQNIIERCYEYIKQSDIINDDVEDC